MTFPMILVFYLTITLLVFGKLKSLLHITQKYDTDNVGIARLSEVKFLNVLLTRPAFHQ